MNSPRLTVVVAAHNEALALPMLHPRLRAVLDTLEGIDGRVVYVDDGSTDTTWAVMQGLAEADPCVGALRLSRNFGKEAALTAGLDVVDDGDRQHQQLGKQWPQHRDQRLGANEHPEQIELGDAQADVTM